MAVYEGARRSAPGIALRRDRRTTSVVARRGNDRVILALGVILVAFLLGLFYLSQIMGVATTDYEIDTLLVQRVDIGRQLRSVEGDIARWGAEPAIVAGAQAAGLDRLGNVDRLAAR